MIGFTQRYKYEDSPARFSDRLRSGMPVEIIGTLDRMEYSQLRPWSGADGKMYAAIYFVLKGNTTDKVVYIDVICEDEPITDQIQHSWKEFGRLFPFLAEQTDKGNAIVTLQFER